MNSYREFIPGSGLISSESSTNHNSGAAFPNYLPVDRAKKLQVHAKEWVPLASYGNANEWYLNNSSESINGRDNLIEVISVFTLLNFSSGFLGRQPCVRA